jgi:mRNA-degrading endonuclease RelE of RelBE toxin-antitoxin system
VRRLRFAKDAPVTYTGVMTFIETPVFTKLVEAYLSQESYIELQQALLFRPETGVVMPRSGGLRKMRWGSGQRGKRGGLRVIYYWDKPHDVFYMLFLYPKSEQEDLTPAQVKRLRDLVREYLA